MADPDAHERPGEGAGPMRHSWPGCCRPQADGQRNTPTPHARVGGRSPSGQTNSYGENGGNELFQTE